MGGLSHWRADLARPVRRIRGVASALDERGDEMSDQGIAGKFVVGDGLPQGIETRQYGDHLRVDLSEDARELLASMSEQDLRRFIREAVQQVLDDIAHEAKQA